MVGVAEDVGAAEEKAGVQSGGRAVRERGTKAIHDARRFVDRARAALVQDVRGVALGARDLQLPGRQAASTHGDLSRIGLEAQRDFGLASRFPQIPA